VKHRNAPPKITRQAAALQERARKGGAGVQLDVRLKAGNPISISGRGLNVALDGGMRITGTPGALVPEGSFKMERGSVTLPARRLEFERGTLTFDSNFDPLIDFTAVSRRSDATITLTVRGRASEPEIRVTSSPELPEEEALAKLIFDNSLLQLSPLQAAQIANYIATLSGNSDAGLLTGLQNALGFDWLDFTESETGEAQVGIGKRLNDKLSVGVEQGTETGTTRVIIDLNATRSLKLRGAVGSDGSTRAGVYYEKDY
jgi:translocation and assembly module TamB